jgi:dipeptidyl aminopeptidase/acylaminoacyl peptidase
MKNPIGAYANITWSDGAEIDGYYFSFGEAYPDEDTGMEGDWSNDSFEVPDDNIFFYCDRGEEQLKSYMKEGLEGFLIRSYELIYDLEEICI